MSKYCNTIIIVVNTIIIVLNTIIMIVNDRKSCVSSNFFELL